ncbi:MAG: Yip1 family protein, partial [Methanoregula sp.]
MYAEIKELLFQPNAFFTRKAGAGINLVPPAIIVLIVSIANFLSPYVGNYLSPRVSGPVTVIWPLDSFLITVLGPFIAWILISGILYVLCRWFSGTGTFMATLQNTGYCVLPLTIFTVIMLIGNMAAVQFMAIPYA